ncbi:MAG TPA: hypothetical protein VMU18_02320 [Rhodoblastus sp.]|nr:hypothetical protein [Rhodoblastus sp.]
MMTSEDREALERLQKYLRQLEERLAFDLSAHQQLKALAAYAAP